MLDMKLTLADRTNPKRCGERFAHGMFTGTESAPYIRDGQIHATEGMLAYLLAEVYSIGFDAGVAVESEKRAYLDSVKTG